MCAVPSADDGNVKSGPSFLSHDSWMGGGGDVESNTIQDALIIRSQRTCHEMKLHGVVKSSLFPGDLEKFHLYCLYNTAP